MLFALVDIETTGGHASAHGITEVAICIHDGKEIIRRYETLVNPHQQIPVFIQAMTGISQNMVDAAPDFADVADEIFALLHDKVFVAHNVHFDHSFLKHHLAAAGFELNVKKLCTVRLGRKIFPGLPSYGLGKICAHFSIDNSARHRAMGDCYAMTQLFGMMLANDRDGHIDASLKQRSSEYSLPANLPKADIENLPSHTGVYYFHDKKGKVIYVGKAKNLKRRVLSHFINNKPGPQKQGFMRKIFRISFKSCASDLMAHILEAVEIKKLWPEFNRSQKQFEQSYGLFLYEDQKGFLHLEVGKKVKYSQPVYTINRKPEAINLLQLLAEEFSLCLSRCGFACAKEDCSCKNTYHTSAIKTAYNNRVQKALGTLKSLDNTFAIEDGNPDEKNYLCVLVEGGQFYGLSESRPGPLSLNEYKEKVSRYPSTLYLNNLVQSFAAQNPHKRIRFTQ